MPLLSFYDVFSEEKAAVLREHAETQTALKCANIFIMYWMKKMGMDKYEVTREQFEEVAGYAEGLVVSGNNDQITFEVMHSTDD